MRVYVAGPYTKGDVAVNVRNAILVANDLLEMGHVPFCPHLSHFWHLVTPRPYEEWLAIDIEWLRQCEAVYRMDGESSGADLEVADAQGLRIPIYSGREGIAILRSLA